MKKTIKISYLYFATGLILCLYLLFSQNLQTLNIGDTYYVISEYASASFISLIYLVLGAIYLVMEKYLNFRIKLIQYLLFNIPFIYFLFSDITNYKNPGYYLENPIAYDWYTIYIPTGLIFCFLISIVLFISLFVFAFFELIKSRK